MKWRVTSGEWRVPQGTILKIDRIGAPGAVPLGFKGAGFSSLVFSPGSSSLVSSLLRTFCVLCAFSVSFSFCPASRAQDLEKPLQSIDEEVTAFSFAPDGRIVYSVYRRLKTKQFDALEHDDIWLQEAGGKRRRLLEGQKYSRGNQTFSYLIESFRWSPSGHIILAQLLTTTVLDEAEKTEDSYETLLFDDTGHEVRVAKGENLIKDAANSTLLPDNTTLAYLSETVKPHQLFSLKTSRLNSGPFPSPHEGRTFRDLAWLPRMNFAIAVEQDRAMNGPPRLQTLDVLTDADQELATLDDYEGGLSVSPSGAKVAYFIDKEVLEIRSVTTPSHVARIRIGLGVFHWSPDESRILLKRALEKKSGDLVWIALPPLAATAPGREIPVSQPVPAPVFRGISFRDFAISPDGGLLAVVVPGKRNLLVFPLPH